jgi:hypothetical protein
MGWVLLLMKIYSRSSRRDPLYAGFPATTDNAKFACPAYINASPWHDVILRCAQILTQKLLYSRQEIAIFMAGATEFNQRKAL